MTQLIRVVFFYTQKRRGRTMRLRLLSPERLFAVHDVVD